MNKWLEETMYFPSREAAGYKSIGFKGREEKQCKPCNNKYSGREGGTCPKLTNIREIY